ncbi:hypothetical protein GA0070604_6202 [Micromonospora eburnea]|uniref:Lipoprotein n=1 Tax=Micromonospora eburnea TaxID=227316 RepID=A0A1C6VP75_9ACTN|nr:hypothetical protein GA0070604_6202 [Micromonospora eburnea]
MPPTPPCPTPRRQASPPAASRTPRAVAAALVTLLSLAACGAPPELNQQARPTVTPTATSTPTPSATPTAPDMPDAQPRSPSPDPSATPCGSGPTGDRVIALLRGGARVLPRDVRVTVRQGPLCVEDWQYTVLAVAGHEELQAVTQGKPTTLELVTAGTDVCSAEVRAAGPPGIRALACGGVPGA